MRTWNLKKPLQDRREVHPKEDVPKAEEDHKCDE